MQASERNHDIKDAAIQNELVSVDPHWVPHHLRPIAQEMAVNGEPPYALVSMTQAMMKDVRSRQPLTVHYAATREGFNQSAGIMFRQF